jgi:hypothetical protein
MHFLKNHLVPILHHIIAILLVSLITAIVTTGALLTLANVFRVSAFSVVAVPLWLIVFFIAIFLGTCLVLFFRNWISTTGAPWITFAVDLHHRPVNAKFKCKILVHITNEIPGQSLRLANAYFVFSKTSPLTPDPKWSRESKTGRLHLCFFSPPTQMHDWRDVYLRSGESTNAWVGINPAHGDQDIEQAAAAENIGRLYFRMTRWTDSGNPKTRWVRKKL